MNDFRTLTERERQDIIQRTIDTSAMYEKTFGNCAQCCLAGLSDIFPDLGIDNKVFKSAFGFGGGYAVTTKGTCGALNGAAMAISLILGRERNNMEADHKACYDAVFKVYAQFIERFGGIRCCDVQTSLFGQCFDFRIDGESEKYAEAGGHTECSKVVGAAAGYVAELIVSGAL